MGDPAVTGGLATTLHGTLAQPGKMDTSAHVVMTWALANPAEIKLDIFYENGEGPVTWTVARTAFVHAVTTFTKGAWVGVGSFALCFDGDLVRFAFRPTWLDRGQWAFIRLPGAQVSEFIAHADRIIPAAGALESAVNTVLVDQAIARILA